jgi:hypothetical protein
MKSGGIPKDSWDWLATSMPKNQSYAIFHQPRFEDSKIPGPISCGIWGDSAEHGSSFPMISMSPRILALGSDQPRGVERYPVGSRIYRKPPARYWIPKPWFPVGFPLQ